MYETSITQVSYLSDIGYGDLLIVDGSLSLLIGCFLLLRFGVSVGPRRPDVASEQRHGHHQYFSNNLPLNNPPRLSLNNQVAGEYHHLSRVWPTTASRLSIVTTRPIRVITAPYPPLFLLHSLRILRSRLGGRHVVVVGRLLGGEVKSRES